MSGAQTQLLDSYGLDHARDTLFGVCDGQEGYDSITDLRRHTLSFEYAGNRNPDAMVPLVNITGAKPSSKTFTLQRAPILGSLTCSATWVDLSFQ